MEEQIAACALDHYENVLPAKGKPRDTEWTVYAALVAVEIVEEKESRTATTPSPKKEHLWVVSCATGTKCATFPQQLNGIEDNSKEDVEINILRDCHAEALTRRGLMKTLWKEIRDYITTKKESKGGGEAVVLENSSKNRRLLDPQDDATVENPTFKMRSNVSLHLYVSDPPCGDASIYPLLDEDDNNFTGAKVIVNVLNGVQPKDCSELLHASCIQVSTNNSSNIHNSIDSNNNNTHPKESASSTTNAAAAADNTGSSSIAHVVAREDVQLLGKLRTKSGRSNLPSHMRSSCMSCSDKLVRWSVLGLQGSLLIRSIPSPIRLESIVVSHDLRALKSAQEEALHRATQQRVESTLGYLSQKEQQGLKNGESNSSRSSSAATGWKGPQLHIVARRFARGKSSNEYEKKRRAKESTTKSSGSLSSNNNSNSNCNKKRKRDASFSSSPCGICLNWDQSLLVSSQNNKKKDKNNINNESETAEDNSISYVEQIVGSRGICQGKKPKSVRDYRLMTSRLSRATFVAEHERLFRLSGSSIDHSNNKNRVNEADGNPAVPGQEECDNLNKNEKKRGSTVNGDKDNNNHTRKFLSYKKWKQTYGGDATYRQVRSTIFAEGSPLAGWLTDSSVP